MTDGVFLVRGANCVIPGAGIRLDVSWRRGCAVDVCALLLTGDRKVRDDGDFVFYNNPEHAGGAVRLTDAGGTDAGGTAAAVTVDLPQVPADIHHVLLAGSLEVGTFDTVPELCVRVGHPGGTVATYRVDDVEAVSAMVFGEIYRHGGGWKFRAVGQGWSSGLAGLATDYGISVEDESSSVISQAEAMRHLQQMVTFAFADDVIEQHEVDEFEKAVGDLGVSGPAVDAMRQRLTRGLALAAISAGRLPEITESTLLLDAGERVHLDTPSVHLRTLDSGDVKRTAGRVVATSRQLMFLSASGGHKIKWTNIVELRPEYANVVVLGMGGNAGGAYEVEDPEYVAAVFAGALKVTRRTATVAIPAQRDSRAVPHAMKLEVWRRDGGACVDCAATEYLEFDHVIPWSLGGATSVGNLQLLCRRCNLAKGARI